MPERPEADPLPAHVDAVIEQVLRPQLELLASELGHPLQAVVRTVKDGTVFTPEAVLHTTPSSDPAHEGVVHIRFRTTFFSDRRLFLVDSVFPPDARTPSFTGFSVRGRVESQGSTVRVHFSTWTVKRNDPVWRRWL
jgi:hypothetical protein